MGLLYANRVSLAPPLWCLWKFHSTPPGQRYWEALLALISNSSWTF